MQGITCLNCGAEHSTESRYCKKCGKLLPAVCFKCDTESLWHLARCKECGNNLIFQKLGDEKLEVDAELVEWLKSYLSSANENVKEAVA